MSKPATFFMPGVPPERWGDETLRLTGRGRPKCVYSIVYREGTTVVEVTVGRRRRERQVVPKGSRRTDIGMAFDRVGPASPTGTTVSAIVMRHTECAVYDLPDTTGAWADPTVVSQELILKVVPFSADPNPGQGVPTEDPQANNF